MKITIWIRSTEDGQRPTLRLDAKYESYDTPRVANYGNRLIKAIEDGCDKSGATDG